ncbi:MAG: TAXI family TRAP transporter solute-binding subunit [Pirellulaceae bacterium]|nr:TAXI family TRAP transporter solute-binding subunit [Pirellulaceae bacterium]
MKTWHWLEGVPVVGALTGRSTVHSSISHRRFQAGMLLLVLMTPLVLAGLWHLAHRYDNAMPATIQIAGGLEGGVYNDVSSKIAQRIAAKYPVKVDVQPTGGSFDNRTQLVAGHVQMAPLQASAISGDDLCVVAPLFYEAVHVLVRHDSTIQSVEHLGGRQVAIGPPGSGSRRTAELVFDSLTLQPPIVPREVATWSALESDDPPESAVICIGRGSRLVSRLLSSGKWRLVPIPSAIQIALQHPTLRPMNIAADQYVDAQLPATGIATIGTTAFLAARNDAPGEMIEAALEALYAPPTIFPSLIPRHRAAEWQGLAFHPVARRFFQAAPDH